VKLRSIALLTASLFARAHETWALSLEAHALQSMKWLTELKSVRTTNASFLSSLWKAISVAGTGLYRGHAIECECEANVLP
jgi:hypothetical protein